MTGNRIYPDEAKSGFPTPPRSFADREDREIRIEAVDEDALDAVAEMYVAFDPADRAQGIPPAGEDRVYDWLDAIFDDGINVAAFHGDDVAGHATLVPDEAHGQPGEHAYELAIFVLQASQRAGIGRELLVTLLGHGAEMGVDRVWLTVERWNGAAISLYKRTGFETVSTESFDIEMAIRLDGS